MNANTNLPKQPDDGLDRLMGDYFQNVMNRSWPEPPRPWESSVQPARRERSETPAKSRWALAASVALLLGLAWLTSGRITDGQPRSVDSPDTGSASTKNIKEMNRKK